MKGQLRAHGGDHKAAAAVGMTTNFNLSYVPLIGAGPPVQRTLVIDRKKLQKNKLKPSFSTSSRFNYDDEDLKPSNQGVRRKTRTRSKKKKGFENVKYASQSPCYSFTKKTRFDGIRDSDFCLGAHTLSFSSVQQDHKSWHKGFHMDKVRVVI